MPRIKIEDLPKDMTITKEEMKKVMGGAIKDIGFQDFVGGQDLEGNIYIDEGNLFSPVEK